MTTVSPPESTRSEFWSYVLRLPHDPCAPRVARMTVRAALTGHGMDELLDITELLTSELATNAYLHAKGPASLRLRGLGRGGLRVFVWDTNPYVPPPFDKPPGVSVSQPAQADAVGGRGLLLVQEYASSWGGWPLGDDRLGRGAGKLLWFEVGGYGAMRRVAA
ncbi:ATP-binding protein [Streptomyces sporangiiformans]|uniref:ATP-binding protein n=1 Tax=Streptomyces sporangiiformans TaxID=2315329 RepID=A0A505DBL7_9ACTN|nr:ATP-binding protein [Streptomyces sporangiiformans]TPQ20237.1 ATP-binding protein [Streptomyces sporangiiformans]